MDPLGLVAYSDSENSQDEQNPPLQESTQKVQTPSVNVDKPRDKLTGKKEKELIEDPSTQKNEVLNESDDHDSEFSEIDMMIRFLSSLYSEKNQFPKPITTQTCDEQLEEKFQHFYDLKKQGFHFNEQLIKNKNFNNPSIYDKLLEHLEIQELGTNFPISQFNPKEFPECMYYDKHEELRQKIEEEKALKNSGSAEGHSHTPRTGVAFVSRGVKTFGTLEESSSYSKSKIDPNEALKKASQVASMLSKDKKSHRQNRWDRTVTEK
ncbi:hypothetical protein BB560_005479 [Smittium megazygosporum]|uniref:HCNGP-like protein n=1 Tax=Smittium megazygosporum TaxID=133381 RepID=A0A2T9Z4X2_9FUNG|nr:hypothetical protein BB560_005479 [Smittium megazygosporum]